jgi:hypothetical protein
LIHDGAYLSSCGDEASELEAAAGSSALLSNSTPEAATDEALDAALMLDDCCSGTEPTVYATIALVTAGLSCLCCYVGADKVDDTGDRWALLLMYAPMAVPLLLVNAGFWIGCTATDSSVEGPYSVTMLILGSVQIVWYMFAYIVAYSDGDKGWSVVAGVLGCICVAQVVAAAGMLAGDVPYLSSCDHAAELRETALPASDVSSDAPACELDGSCTFCSGRTHVHSPKESHRAYDHIEHIIEHRAGAACECAAATSICSAHVYAASTDEVCAPVMMCELSGLQAPELQTLLDGAEGGTVCVCEKVYASAIPATPEVDVISVDVISDVCLGSSVPAEEVSTTVDEGFGAGIWVLSLIVLGACSFAAYTKYIQSRTRKRIGGEWEATVEVTRNVLAGAVQQTQAESERAAAAEQQTQAERERAAAAVQQAQAQSERAAAVEHAAQAERERAATVERQLAQLVKGSALWECNVDGNWIAYDDPTTEILEAAFVRRDTDARFKRGGFEYSINTTMMMLEQLNLSTKVTREVRRTRALEAPAVMPVPASWSAQPPGQNCALVTVASHTTEFNAVEGKIKATMPTVQIQKLERIQNVLLWKKYSMRKALMTEVNGKDPNEKSVWHGTRGNDPKVIYEDKQDGFMFQHSQAGMWGRGIYFAENASYSDGYAHNCGGGQKSFMLTKLLSGEETHIPSDGSLKMCPDKPGGGRYDTVTGDTGGSKVYIVYENGRALPEYLVTYKS